MASTPETSAPSMPEPCRVVSRPSSRRTFKVIVLGDANVGKTCLSYRFCTGKFPVNTTSTIGVDFREKVVELDNEQLRVQFWDTAGQERFRQSMVAHYYRNIHAILFVFDISQDSSFRKLPHWFEECQKQGVFGTVPMFLIANKCDITPAQVSMEEAQRFADQYDMPLFMLSAMAESDAEHIQSVFMTLVHILQKNKEVHVTTNEERVQLKAHLEDQSYDSCGLHEACVSLTSNRMRLLLDGHFGVCTLSSRFDLASTECGPNGLPLTPASIAIIGRFQKLRALRCSYLCQYLDVQRGKYERLFLISEHYHKCLHSVIAEEADVRLKRFVSIAFGILSALQYLHSLGIVHRFLNSDNVLLTDKFGVRLSNYGLYYATDSGRDTPVKFRHPVYSAPETYVFDERQQSSGPKVDIWSAGMVMLELLLGIVLFKAECRSPNFMVHYMKLIKQVPLMDSIVNRLQTDESYKSNMPAMSSWPPEYVQLVSACLQLKPSKRQQLSASELLRMDLFGKCEEETASSRIQDVFSDSSSAKELSFYAQSKDELLCYLKEPYRLRPVDEMYAMWTLCGSKVEAILIKQNVIEERPPILCLPELVIGDFDLVGHGKDQLHVFEPTVHPLCMNNLIEKMSSVNPLIHFPLLEMRLRSCPEMTDRNVDNLPLLVKEKDVTYQLKRTALFSRLLLAFPYTRERILAEAVFDVPPIYRGLVWCALLDISCTVCNAYALIDKDVETAADRQIEVDIPRCHQYDELLSSPIAHEKFKRVIKAWIISHPQYVYWQGLDSLCAPFLYLNFEDEHLAFACLTSFIDLFLKDFFLRDNSAVMKEYLLIFENALAYYDCAVFNHLRDIKFHPELYAIPWFLTMFAHVMPLHKLFHVWDMLLISGNGFPICIGVAILTQMRHLLLQSSFNDCILLFSDLPVINLDKCLKQAVDVYRVVPKTLLYCRSLSAVFPSRGNWIDDYLVKVGTPLGLNVDNLEAEDIPIISADELLHIMGRCSTSATMPLRLIDIRIGEEFSKRAFPRSQNIPYNSAFKDGHFTMPAALQESLSSDYEMVVIIGSGKDSRVCKIASQLIRLNYSRICILHGGIDVIMHTSLLMAPSNS